MIYALTFLRFLYDITLQKDYKIPSHENSQLSKPKIPSETEDTPLRSDLFYRWRTRLLTLFAAAVLSLQVFVHFVIFVLYFVPASMIALTDPSVYVRVY